MNEGWAIAPDTLHESLDSALSWRGPNLLGSFGLDDEDYKGRPTRRTRSSKRGSDLMLSRSGSTLSHIKFPEC